MNDVPGKKFHLSKQPLGAVQWLTPIIPATREAEIRRITV
jgi:hypothetical protein